jgi:hypothetical protein
VILLVALLLRTRQRPGRQAGRVPPRPDLTEAWDQPDHPYVAIGEELCEGHVLEGSLFSEPVRIETLRPNGTDSWELGPVGVQTDRFRRVTLSAADLTGLRVLQAERSFAGDGKLLLLGLQALALGIAYEFDPYFGLLISRVDPLPHQLEAVYDYLLKYLLKAPRVRFLLADDAGAGKTIMAGLLIRELKLRGLAERIAIVCPSNLAFQWQREMREKFDETFQVLRGDSIREQFGVNQWLEQRQVVTSLDLAKRTDILPGLRQVHWDLVVVDEAHRMSASDPEHKTQRYRLGELLRDTTDHYLLLTATPHRGDPENFSFFLQLLDADVYADIRSIRQAMEQHYAPFSDAPRKRWSTPPSARTTGHGQHDLCSRSASLTAQILRSKAPSSSSIVRSPGLSAARVTRLPLRTTPADVRWGFSCHCISGGLRPAPTPSSTR